ncbi:MAG: hypothetical protein C0596_05675 [Marinilabiliales bacterium]|nr:MAG: hypothetical protein C0596_05675 [Marinilabiliales bacterium]
MPETKHMLLSKQDLRKGLKLNGGFGNMVSGFLMRSFSLNKLNRVYDKCYNENPIKFSENCLKHNNIKLIVPEKDKTNIHENGPALIFLNHPYGGLDALILLKTLLEIRPDTKFLANFLLSRIEPAKPYLIQVNPFEDRKESFSSHGGLKEVYKQLDEGHPVVILPAGEVSTKYNGYKNVEDRDWQVNMIKLAQNASVPVISGYISGSNSKLFHFMGKIKPVLRTAMLPRELLKKKNETIYLRFSGMTNTKTIASFDNRKTLAKVLKSKTYLLQDDCIAHDKKHVDPPHYQQIIKETDNELLKQEKDNLKPNNFLFQTDNYQCFFAATEDIPNIFRELSRLREITFREIGEGTGKDSDKDKYDQYYNHLFILDETANKLVGAYRIGLGSDILASKGVEGFYINSLFSFTKDFEPYLSKSMEMCRSFIVHDYQRKPLPLFLLWKGIYHVTQKYPEYKYLIGPASISNFYSENSKILIIEYLKRNHIWKELSSMVKNKTPYNYQLNHHHNIILQEFGDDLSHIDRFIKDIDINHVGIPVLIKKYLSLGGRIVDFNVDPDFNYSIDGFVVLDIDVVSEEVIKSYNK